MINKLINKVILYLNELFQIINPLILLSIKTKYFPQRNRNMNDYLFAIAE